jgi:hypothetical protein
MGVVTHNNGSSNSGGRHSDNMHMKDTLSVGFHAKPGFSCLVFLVAAECARVVRVGVWWRRCQPSYQSGRLRQRGTRARRLDGIEGVQAWG